MSLWHVKQMSELNTHMLTSHTQFKLYYPIRKSTAVSSFSCLISPAHTLLSYGVTSTDFDPLAVHENHSYTVNHLTRRFAQDLTCLQKCTFFRSFLLLKHYNCSIAFKKSYYNTRLSQQKKPWSCGKDTGRSFFIVLQDNLGLSTSAESSLGDNNNYNGSGLLLT